MSIPIGIYDLFAYAIPGLLYLYVIFEFLRLIGIANLGSFSSAANLPSAVWLLTIAIVAITAHMVGHLFDFFASRFVNRLNRNQRMTDIVLDRFKEKYPELEIQFESKDWQLLFTLLRQRNHEHSRTMDSLEANSIMLRNICFALILLLLLNIEKLIINYNNTTLIITVLILIFSYIAAYRSRMFYSWFFREIFQASLNYGKSLEEVIAFPEKKLSTTRRAANKSKTRKHDDAKQK